MTKVRRVLTFGILLAGVLLMFQSAPILAAQNQQPVQGDVQGPATGPGPAPDQASGQDQGSAGQDQERNPDQAGAQDPPGRIARLNLSEGSVSFQPGGEGDWVQAVPNRPLTTGDNLWADKDSRAELHVGSTAIRMTSETSLTFLELDDRTTQLKLSMGSVILKVRHLDDQDLFEVDTPNLAFTIQRVGEYRVTVNPEGNQTITTVWNGRGEVTGGGESYVVIAGQQARFDGTDQLNHEIDQLPGPDGFDTWAQDRDRHEDHSESVNYISPEMTGAEDLDQYGSWSYAADYGPVWRPAGIPGGWAPYRYGHWVFVGPWGWTWVEDEPWGFAPFHYGRWASVGGGWCWVPGPVVVRPVYAPALVAFVGGGGFGIGVGFGVGVSWFPLAPREVFVPWYRGSRGYVNNVNITNTRVNVTQVTNVYNTTIVNNSTNITRVNYANQHVPSAITSVSHDTFVNARPVSRNLTPVDGKLAQAPVSYRTPAQPVHASVLGSSPAARVQPPAAVANRAVVATRNPTPPGSSFEQRQSVPVVRTQTSGTVRPVTQGAQTPRPQEPSARPSQATNSGVLVQPQERFEPGRSSQPQEHTVPRPADNYSRGSEPAAQQHPLVRPAPPMLNRSEVQRNEEQKFNTWQRQRQNTAPRPPQPRSQQHQQAPHPPHK